MIVIINIIMLGLLAYIIFRLIRGEVRWYRKSRRFNELRVQSEKLSDQINIAIYYSKDFATAKILLDVNEKILAEMEAISKC